MYIKSAQILEARQHQDKTILCQIRVLPRNLEYYYGQTRPCRTYRWMQAEHWAAFDAGLEALLASKEFTAEFQSNGRTKAEPTVEKQFMLNKLIQVRLKPSRVPLQTLWRCIAVGSSELNEQNVALALECIIEYKADGKWKEAAPPEKAPIVDEKKSKNEYEPQPVSSRTDVHLSQDSAAASYVPYTPSTKQPTTVPYTPSATQPSTVPYTASAKIPTASPGELRFNYSDDEYTPATVGDGSSSDKISQTPSPVYNPARIRSHRAKTEEPKTIGVGGGGGGGDSHEQNNEEATWFKELQEKRSNRDKETTTSSNKREDSNKKPVEKQSENSNSSKEKTHRKKDKYREKTKHKVARQEDKNLKREHEEQARTSGRHKEAAKSDGSRKDDAASEQGDSDFVSTSGEKCFSNNNNKFTTNHNNNSNSNSNASEDATELRRSARSPHTTVRLIETISGFKNPTSKATKKRAKSKSPNAKKPKNSDIFGTDDEDSEAFVQATPKSKNPFAIGVDNKRRRECGGGDSSAEKDKQSITKWLSKKNDPSSSSTPPPKAKSKRKEKCDTPAPSKKYPSFEEIDRKMIENKRQIEESRKLNAMLKEIAPPPPPKVQILTLCELSADEIMNTYAHHKPKLDAIFEKLRKKNAIRTHDGIDHFLVMNLVDNRMELLMLEKLCEVYENNREGSSVFVELFTNAMMPEWIVGIFMDKYNLTRAEAITQLKGQDEYRLHLEAQMDHTMFM